MNRLEELREQALKKLQEFEVLMRDGHFDYDNGFHGRVYLNPHSCSVIRRRSGAWRRICSTSCRRSCSSQTEIVAGPATGGALLAHTMAGLLDGRRALTHPPCSFAPFTPGEGKFMLRSFYAQLMRGKRVLLADDVRNTGKTFERCAELVREAGGTVLATVEICDRMEAMVDLGVPNYALVEYPAPENYPAAECPMCTGGRAGITILGSGLKAQAQANPRMHTRRFYLSPEP